MAEPRSTEYQSGPRSTEERSAAGCSKRPSFRVAGSSKRMPCDQYVQTSLKQASRTMGRQPGTQSAASSKRPGVALETVPAPRNLGPSQRAISDGVLSGREYFSQRTDRGVPATTAAKSLYSAVPPPAAAPAARSPPDGGGGAGCNIRSSARSAVLSVLGTSSFDSVSAPSPVTATLPIDPGAEAEGSVQARFNT